MPGCPEDRKEGRERCSGEMGSDKSHFNVSLIVKGKYTSQRPQTTSFQETGELKRIRTDVPLLTSLTPYR